MQMFLKKRGLIRNHLGNFLPACNKLAFNWVNLFSNRSSSSLLQLGPEIFGLFSPTRVKTTDQNIRHAEEITSISILNCRFQDCPLLLKSRRVALLEKYTA